MIGQTTVNHLRSVLLAASLFSLACAPASAAYRCVDVKGKTTYQDTACEVTLSTNPVDTSDAFSTKPRSGLPSPPQDAAGDAYANAHGAWRGPAQFQLTNGGVRDADAHAISLMVIELQTNGEVVGVIPATGCQISGLASEFVAPYMASVDVSLKGCRDTRFSVRYTGHLTAARAAKEGRFTLTSMQFLPPLNKARVETIEAVLKR